MERLSIKLNNDTIRDDSVICNTFNSFFIDSVQSIKSSFPVVDNNYINNILSPSNSFMLIPCTPFEVEKILLNLKNNNFHSSIPTRILKNSSSVFSHILSELYNLCFQNSCFPDILKIARIQPIYKSGSKNDVKNYRPISILCPITKILEKLVYNRLYSFFDSHNLFSKQKFGFLKGSGIEKAVLSFLTDLEYYRQNKLSCVACFLDYTKAFDTVDHSLLIRKLNKYGVRGSSLQFFISYLTNRIQYVSCNDNRSSDIVVTNGVPQGSCLGPLLFVIYINDIINITDKVKLKLFADDVLVYIADNDIDLSTVILNDALSSISK